MIYIIASRYEIGNYIARQKAIQPHQWLFIEEPYQLKGLEAPEVILHGSSRDRKDWKDWKDLEKMLKERRARISENWS